MARDETLVEPDPPAGRAAHAWGVGHKGAGTYCGNITYDSPEEFDRKVTDTLSLEDNLDRVTCKACRYQLNLPGGADYGR